MKTKPGVDWLEVKRRLMLGESARAISRDLSARGAPISHVAIAKKAAAKGWKPPAPLETPNPAPGNGVETPPGNPAAGLPGGAQMPLPATFDMPTPKRQNVTRANGKRTAENLRQIIHDVLQGASLHVAANRAGMVYETLNKWRQADQDVDMAVLSACAERDQRRELRIEDAAEHDWSAAKWLLTTQRKDVYGGLETAKTGGITVNVNIGDPTIPAVIDVSAKEL